MALNIRITSRLYGSYTFESKIEGIRWFYKSTNIEALRDLPACQAYIEAHPNNFDDAEQLIELIRAVIIKNKLEEIKEEQEKGALRIESTRR